MTHLMLIFGGALVFAALGTPLMRRVAIHFGILDQPTARKIHLAPTPLLGGVAIYGAFLLAFVLFGSRIYITQGLGIVLGATFVSVFGIWDDSSRLHPQIKLLFGQPLAVVILIVSGVQVNLFPEPALNFLMTAFWMVGITSAMNLLDNMDGLSSGVAAIASAFFVVLAAMSGQYLVGSLAAALLGASLGFLRYNFKPARIFMGDGGSLFLGFILAAVGIKLRFPANAPIVTWMIPVLVLGLPIFDTTLVVVSRLRRGLNPLTTPGKDHVSHRLVARGLTQREAVMALYLVCCGLGVLAMFLSQANVVQAYVIAAAVFIVGILSLWKLEQSAFQR